MTTYSGNNAAVSLMTSKVTQLNQEVSVKHKHADDAICTDFLMVTLAICNHLHRQSLSDRDF